MWRHISYHLPSGKLVLQSHSYGNRYCDTSPILTFSLSPFPFAENIPSPVVSVLKWYSTFQLMLLSSLLPSAISMISSMQMSPDHPTCMYVNVPMDSRKYKNRKASKLRFHHQLGGRSGESEEAMGLSAVMIPLTLVADKRLMFGHLDYWSMNKNVSVSVSVNVNIT